MSQDQYFSYAHDDNKLRNNLWLKNRDDESMGSTLDLPQDKGEE